MTETSSPTAHGRWLSVTFDDGLRRGSDIAAEIMAQHGMTASFYVVTGWVAPMRTAVREKFNRGHDHGDWAHWRSIRDAGHEVGSHTFSHFNVTGKMARLFPWLVSDELRKSREDIAREVSQDLYTISMTWNAASPQSERIVSNLYDACRLGSSKVECNNLSALKPHRLASWAPAGRTSGAEYARAIDAIPNGGWLILQFHSFDNEGWEPLTRDAFTTLCKIVAERSDVKTAPVSRVIADWRATWDNTPGAEGSESWPLVL